MKPIGFALAMRVLQSALYHELDDLERSECDALVAHGKSRNLRASNGSLDKRDQRMLLLLSQGKSSAEVAESLGYEEGTIRVYLSNLYKKIGVSNKTEAAVWFLRHCTPRTGLSQ